MRPAIYIFLLLSSSCASKISFEEYFSECLRSEDYNKSFEATAYKVTCAYRPQEFLTLQELRGKWQKKKAVSEGEFISVSEQFSDGAYFFLRIERRDGNPVLTSVAANPEEYSRLQNYFTFGFQHNFYGLVKGDTIRPALYNFENSYGNLPSLDFLFVFPKREFCNTPAQEVEMCFEDEFLNISKNSFSYKSSVFQDQPNLNFQ